MSPAEIHDRAAVPVGHLRRLVAAVVVAAALVVLAAGAQALATPGDPWVLAVSAMAVAVATAVPVLVQQGTHHDGVHGHVAVLLPVLYLLPWHDVVVVVAAGVAVGWVLRRVWGRGAAPPGSHGLGMVAPLSRSVLAAAAGGSVASWPAAGTTAAILLAVAGALVFLGIEGTLATAATPAGGRQASARRVRRLLGVHASAGLLGVLTTMVVAAYPAPAAWLAVQAVLGTTIVLALSMLDTERAHHVALLRIAAHAHASMDVSAVEQAVDDILTPLVRAARVEVRDLPPGHDDVGTPLPLSGGDPAWLIATHRGRVAGGFSRRDRRLLASAAPLVATAVENARRHGDMTARASTDPLTGIANRRTFEEHLALRLRHARITDTTTALVILDLDAFKAINDEIGHGAGDELLVEIARRLTACLRAADLVARLGGDEFAVVAGLSSADEEDTLVERIADGLGGLQASDGRAVGVSFGLALAPRDGQSVRELYDVADQRMYAVKHGEAA